MCRKWRIALFLSSILLCSVAIAQQTTTSKSQSKTMNSVDRSFVRKAAEANLAEIQTAQVVEQKANDPAVKDFASRMISDHTQANQKLAAIAGIALPKEPSAVERNQKNELGKLSGSKLLDEKYVADELSDHKQVISEFEKEIEEGQDPAIKTYAEQTLPTLEDHIRLAEDVAGKMGMSGKAGLNVEAKAITAR
jgi:putative membrane protein